MSYRTRIRASLLIFLSDCDDNVNTLDFVGGSLNAEHSTKGEETSSILYFLSQSLQIPLSIYVAR